jgi:DNA mismatch repair protein MutS
MALLQTYKALYNKYQASYGDDTCIFLLVGKFYELYDTINPQTDTSYTSMLRATQIMNIQVNKKETAEGQTLFAGIPEQSRDKFAQTLTSRGWTVVIVDQVKTGTKVTDRVTARILSPGTHVEMAGQDRMSVAALVFEDGQYSCSVNDLTTGEVFSLVGTADSVLHMFQIYNVSEVVATDISHAKSQFGVQIHQIAQSNESAVARHEYFRRMFKVKSLMPVITLLSISEPIEKCLLYLLRFVEDHFPQQAERLTSHTMYNPGQHLRLANNIIEQLNIITKSHKSVLDLVDHTHTAIGKRAMRERILRPITNPVELEERWGQIEWATQNTNPHLKGMYDLPRLHFKIASANINSIDILQLFQSYGATACLIQSLVNTPLACTEDLVQKISDYRKAFEVFDEDKATKKSQGEVIGFLTAAAGPRTAAIEQKIEEIQTTWKAALETFCKGANISPNLFTIEKKSDGYILEAPRNLHSALTAKKFTGSTFTPTLKKSGPLEISCDAFTTFCQSMLFAESQLEKVLKEEYTPICDSLWDILKDLQPWIDWIGNVDCSLALGSIAVKYKWCKPAIGNSLAIKGLRHPLLESATHANARLEYIKHDVALDDTQNGWLIYGVNASGKSSLMKATGIAVILAQAGSFVPASSMTIRPYDAAFSRIWTHDNIWAGLSSFAVEIAELSDILRLSTSRSLVLGDEVCSGTESSSATALVAATIESLEKKGTHFMFATHLHDLLKVKGFPRPGVAVWHLRVITQPDGKLIYDRSLQPGPGSATYGLEVAKAMGLPFDLIQRAHEIRRSLEGITTVQDAPKSVYNTQIQRQACEVCKSPCGLEVHHIEEQAKGGSNELRNLIVVCESCHDKHHNGTIQISPLTQTSYGLERFAKLVNPADKHTESTEKPTKNKNEELIRKIISENRGKVPIRICQIIQESHSIHITVPQLKRYL